MCAGWRLGKRGVQVFECLKERQRDVPGRGCYGNRYSFECLKEKMCSVKDNE